MINIAIVEDEHNEQDTLTKMISDVCVNLKVNNNIQCFDNGLQFLETGVISCDLLFLDIELPHMNGMEVARKIRETNQDMIIVFVTNMAQYALEGYEVRALSYLLKPVQTFAIENIIKKSVQIIDKYDSVKVCLEIGDLIKTISSNDIYYIEIVDHNCFIHTANEVVEYRKTLSYFENLLINHGFVRCNSCYLINLRYVEAFDKKVLIMKNKDSLQVSRSRYKSVLSSLKNYYGDRM